MKRMTHGKGATWEECNVQRKQHKKNTISYKYNLEILEHEKSAALRKYNLERKHMKLVQHKTSATGKVSN